MKFNFRFLSCGSATWLLFFSISSCEKPAAPVEPWGDYQKKEVVVEVKAMFDAYSASVEKNGMIGEKPFLDNSEDFFWVPPGFNRPISYDSVVYYAEKTNDQYSSVHLRWVDLRIVPQSKELAVYTATLEALMFDTLNRDTRSVLLETGVVVKRASGWKLLCGQSAIKP